MVPLNGLKPNVQQRFDRLEAAWNQARMGIRGTEAPQREDDFDVVTEPSGPPRTPPTPEEVSASRTARASGESVRSIAELFNKHRSIVAAARISARSWTNRRSRGSVGRMWARWDVEMRTGETRRCGAIT